jgi:hypothetical protein
MAGGGGGPLFNLLVLYVYPRDLRFQGTLMPILVSGMDGARVQLALIFVIANILVHDETIVTMHAYGT